MDYHKKVMKEVEMSKSLKDYIRHLLTEIPRLVDKNENISQSILDPLMPWSKNLPADCYSKRRK